MPFTHFKLHPRLGEVNPDIYDGLAAGLLSYDSNNVAILYPIPCHFVRRKNVNSCKGDHYKIEGNEIKKNEFKVMDEIIDGVKMDPSDLVFGFKQYLTDIQKLIEEITGITVGRETDIRRFASNELDENVNVSLLGYSLGGLEVISAMLFFSTGWIRDQRGIDVMADIRKKISTYILIESGASLISSKAGILFKKTLKNIKTIFEDIEDPREFDTNRLFLKNVKFDEEKQKTWEKMIRDLEDGKIQWEDKKKDLEFLLTFTRDDKSGELIWETVIEKLHEIANTSYFTPMEKKIFEMVALGNHQYTFQKSLSENVNKLMILLGGIDEIFSPTLYYSFAPEKTGLAIFQIPELGHWLKFSHSTKWKQWRPFISALIDNFRILSPTEQNTEQTP